jgi:hypothetical protein
MLLMRKMRKYQNLVIHSICDGHGIISGWLFATLAGRVRLCYNTATEEWDERELMRDQPQCYFLTGKPE